MFKDLTMPRFSFNPTCSRWMHGRDAHATAMLPLLFCLLALPLIGGCSSGPSDPGVPKSASLVAELTGSAGSSGDRFTPLEADSNGALYVYDIDRQQLAYSGAVEQGNQIRLSPAGVVVVSILPGRSRTAYEHSVLRFDMGAKYRVYFEPGGKPLNPTQQAEGSPLTRPYQERTIERRPSEQK